MNKQKEVVTSKGINNELLRSAEQVPLAWSEPARSKLLRSAEQVPLAWSEPARSKLLLPIDNSLYSLYPPTYQYPGRMMNGDYNSSRDNILPLPQAQECLQNDIDYDFNANIQKKKDDTQILRNLAQPKLFREEPPAPYNAPLNGPSAIENFQLPDNNSKLWIIIILIIVGIIAFVYGCGSD